MNIGITGASGFVGRRLAERLRLHTIRPISTRRAPDPAQLAGCDAVIHLAGEPIAQRWSNEVKTRIRVSRVEGTRALVEAMRPNPPSVLVSASAVGYYGSRGDDTLTETSAPGDDFLAKVAVEWEREAFATESFGTRVVAMRTRMVLGHGGALERMLRPFRWGVGGRIGNGRQWMPWIHIDDLAALIEFALTNAIRGPVNACSPNPVTNAVFTRELARAIHRPAVFPVPKFALRMLYGEMADVLFASQRVAPEAALRAGFEFQFPELCPALRDLL
jgi:uncharacterized protein (TIGR01777 family)